MKLLIFNGSPRQGKPAFGIRIISPHEGVIINATKVTHSLRGTETMKT